MTDPVITTPFTDLERPISRQSFNYHFGDAAISGLVTTMILAGGGAVAYKSWQAGQREDAAVQTLQQENVQTASAAKAQFAQHREINDLVKACEQSQLAPQFAACVTQQAEQNKQSHHSDGITAATLAACAVMYFGAQTAQSAYRACRMALAR